MITHPDHLELESLALATGTADQRERWYAHLLPDNELLLLARNEIFRPFQYSKRWCRIESTQMRHRSDCYRARSEKVDWDDDVEFSSRHAPFLPAGKVWDAYQDLVRLAKQGDMHQWVKLSGSTFEVTARLHQATCKRCGERTVRESAAVSVVWAGRTLTREYAL